MSEGILYIVGTPIGNLNDITNRALDILKQVDFIVAEDTRVTLKLLNHFGIKNTLISYYKYSDNNKILSIIEKILEGKSCALVSDAGMPCISDPGEELIKSAYKVGIDVKVIPGPSALISALVISGQNVSRFIFEGFLSQNKKDRYETLLSLQDEERTIIFYEAPHKLKKTLKDLLEILGDRSISVVKELTKIYENVMLTTLKEAITYFESIDKIKGEYVLIISGKKIEKSNKTINKHKLINMLNELRKTENISTSESIKIISQQTGVRKNLLYHIVMKENKK